MKKMRLLGYPELFTDGLFLQFLKAKQSKILTARCRRPQDDSFAVTFHPQKRNNKQKEPARKI